jgi:hypothetical protein
MTTEGSLQEKTSFQGAPTAPKRPHITHDFGFLPIPKRLQHSPEHPHHHFTLGINMLFFLLSLVYAGNISLCVPILLSLSREFHVSYETSSKLATLQAGLS